jgi:hypothetical protein
VDKTCASVWENILHFILSGNFQSTGNEYILHSYNFEISTFLRLQTTKLYNWRLLRLL